MAVGGGGVPRSIVTDSTAIKTDVGTLKTAVETLNANLTALKNAHVNQGDLSHGSKTAPTGTAEAIASSQAVPNGFGVVLKTLNTNEGKVYVGKTGVTTATGVPLEKGESIVLYINNLNLIYVIGSVASQVVRYIVEKETE